MAAAHLPTIGRYAQVVIARKDGHFPMSETAAARSSSSADAQAVPRLLALAAVAVGFSASRARLYPLIFDAMLVVAAAAVLSLREAGLALRCCAWLVLLVLIAAAAGADVLHATGTHLPHRTAAVVAAIIPWALVLIAFGLLLAMLRHARLRRAAANRSRPRQARDAGAQPAAIAAGDVQPAGGARADLAPGAPPPQAS